MKKHDVNDVVAFFGGDGPFSILLGVSREAIKQWQREKKFPPRQAAWVEVLSDGKFRRDRLPVEDAAILWTHAMQITPGMLLDRSIKLRESAEKLRALSDLLHAKYSEHAAA